MRGAVLGGLGGLSVEERRRELTEPTGDGARLRAGPLGGAPGSGSICSPPGRACGIRGGGGQPILQLQLLARLCRPAEAANQRELDAGNTYAEKEITQPS